MIELATEPRVHLPFRDLRIEPNYCPPAHAKPLCSFERSWLFVCLCIDSNQLITTNKGANKLLYKLINNTLEHSWLIDCAWTIRAPLGTWTSHQANNPHPHTTAKTYLHSSILEDLRYAQLVLLIIYWLCSLNRLNGQCTDTRTPFRVPTRGERTPMSILLGTRPK